MAVFGTVISTDHIVIAGPPSAETPGATVTINLATRARVRTWTAGQDETVNLTGTQASGDLLILIITNDATTGRTITLGTGFVSSGAVVGVTSKVSILTFVSNGTNYYELARTVGI